MPTDDLVRETAEEILRRLGFANEQVRANRADVPGILRTAFAEALEDTARLEHLIATNRVVCRTNLGEWFTARFGGEGFWEDDRTCLTLRTAIDATRKQE